VAADLLLPFDPTSIWPRLSWRHATPSRLRVDIQVLIDAHGHVRLADLNTAKVDPALSHGARTFSVVGTPFAAAPEVFASKGYTTAADWWSCTRMRPRHPSLTLSPAAPPEPRAEPGRARRCACVAWVRLRVAWLTRGCCMWVADGVLLFEALSGRPPYPLDLTALHAHARLVHEICHGERGAWLALNPSTSGLPSHSPLAARSLIAHPEADGSRLASAAPLPSEPPLSTGALDLVDRLLDRSETSRLVSPRALRCHGFFSGVRWEMLLARLVPSPLLPPQPPTPTPAKPPTLRRFSSMREAPKPPPPVDGGVIDVFAYPSVLGNLFHAPSVGRAPSLCGGANGSSADAAAANGGAAGAGGNGGSGAAHVGGAAGAGGGAVGCGVGGGQLGTAGGKGEGEGDADGDAAAERAVREAMGLGAWDYVTEEGAGTRGARLWRVVRERADQLARLSGLSRPALLLHTAREHGVSAASVRFGGLLETEPPRRPTTRLRSKSVGGMRDLRGL
jgi:hypothetical protein